ncbi:helix-turn-helix transcriptional regulator [Micromonospora sp. NBRC 101691]|uniref:helix-turn-helix domain-containing protein n=1 Tax=Micromonospora sp. NBRC 101691 TaxID=3032198 RepID=UPI0024A4CDBB|nr:helix-turn-helix transcriptional regulator [Micromonospora sp. NBRC 101691]GLY26258.1 transcriptional regulator [Micromonospora sp. NBRC 101691]
MGISPSEFLLRELRRRRVAAGLTQDALGERVHYSNTHVSAIETGVKPPKPEYLKAVDEALETGGILLSLWEDLVRDASTPVWFRNWIEIERQALSLRWYEMTVLPGLLQTEAYARAVFSSGGLLTSEEVERRTAARIARQEVLTRDSPPQFVAVLDEHLLHREVGNAALMRDQLSQLVELSAQLPYVRIHVVPSSTGAYAGMSGPFVMATLEGGDEYAYLDNQLQGQVVDEPSGLLWVRQAWECIRGEALPHRQSIELIGRVAEKWI